MKSAKSIFVTPYLLLPLIALIVSLVQIIEGGDLEIWIPVLLTSLPGFIFFAIVFGIGFPRTSKTIWEVWIPIIIGIVTLLFFSIQRGELNLLAWGIASLMLIGWALYVFWYSSFGDRSNKELKSGLVLPDFPLTNQKNDIVRSTSFFDKPTVFLFYRGNWCPFCMAQIREMAKQYQEIEKQGGQLVLISPQPDSHSHKLANKLNISAHFMTDQNNKAAQQLGLFHKGGVPIGLGAQGYEADTVMPTVVVTGKNGIIRFVDLTDNYRLRPEPNTFLKLLTEAEANLPNN